MAFFNSWRLCDLSEAGVSIMTFIRSSHLSKLLDSRHGIDLRRRMTQLTVFYEIARPMAVAVA